MSRCQMLDLINSKSIDKNIEEDIHEWYLKAIHQLDFNNNVLNAHDSQHGLDMTTFCKIFTESSQSLTAAEVDSKYFDATGNHLPCEATTDAANEFLSQFALLSSAINKNGETVFHVFDDVPMPPNTPSYRTNRLCSMSSYSSFDNASWGHSTVYEFEVLCGGDGTDPVIADLLQPFSNICVDDEIDVDPETMSIASQG